MGRREDFTVGRLNVTDSINMVGGAGIDGVNPSGGEDYYVDGNKTAGGDGLSWDTACKTLAAAITKSDASISLTGNRWWARRNRIFLVADATTETLVKFPTKCDVIGVGSYDGNTKPGIIGHHVPVGESYGTRFYNVLFNSVALGAPIITLNSEASGVQFHGCTFDGTSGTMTSAILATATPIVVNDCDFQGTFVTSYITFGAGQAGKTRILNNRMLGTAAKGIVIPGTTTATWAPIIDNNVIVATGDPIEDASNLFVITNNRMITAANIATTTDGYTFNLALASGNILTGLNGVAATIPFAVITEA